MSVPFIIRPRIPEDRAACLAINIAGWQTAYADIFTPEEIAGAFDRTIPITSSSGEGRGELLDVFVAEWDDKVVGFITISQRNDGSGEVGSLYVHPDHQRQGVGRSLWMAVIDFLRGQNIETVTVWTLERGGAVEFYERLGCTRFTVDTITIGDHEERTIGLKMPAP